MTLLANSARAPDPLTEGVVDYQLVVFSPDARTIERTFSYLSEAQAGLTREISARLDPSGAGRALVFTGDPARVGCTGGEIIRFRVNDGLGWHDVFYGTVTEGWASEPMDEPKTFVARADELLEATVTDARAYGPQDPAAIAGDLVKRLRHPALHYDPANFPSTGTTLEGGFEQPGITLLEALELLAQSAEGAGRTISFGIDGAGYVFFREAAGIAEILYREEDVAGFEPLPVNADDIVTAVYWVIGNAPSDPALKMKGEIEWGTEAYLSVPEPDLHTKYNRIVGRTVGNPSQYYRASKVDVINENGFSVSNGVATKNTEVTTGALISVRLGLPDTAPLYFSTRRNARGVRLTYRRDYDVADARVYMDLQFSSTESNVGLATSTDFAEYLLPFSHEKLTTIDLYFPNIRPFYQVTFDKNVLFDVLSRVSFYVRSRGPGLGLQVKDPYIFHLNTALLDAAALRELRSPAREPSSIRPTRDTEDGLKTYYVKPQPTARLRLYPGEPTQATAEWRISFNENNLVETVIDLGNKSRKGDAELIEQIRLGVERKVRRSEVRTIGRL